MYLHSPTVRPKDIVRLSGDPLIQDSLRAQYKRWRMRAVYWFQTMGCYDATEGKPEGDLNPAQLEAFEKINTLLKALF